MSTTHRTTRQGEHLQRGSYYQYKYEITIADDKRTVEKILLGSDDVTAIYLNKEKDHENYIRIRNVVNNLIKQLNKETRKVKYAKLLKLDTWHRDPQQDLSIVTRKYYSTSKVPTGTQSERYFFWIKEGKLDESLALLEDYRVEQVKMKELLDAFATKKAGILNKLQQINAEGVDLIEIREEDI